MRLFLWAEFMSDILSRVQILLDADTARFEQGMRDARDTASSTFDRIADGAKKMTTVVASAAVAGATALIAYGNEHIKVIDELEKYAYLSDATFENFQKMTIGAQALGIESDQLSDMYKDFNEKLGEFNTVGAGGALDFFEQVAVKTEGSSEAAIKLMKHMADLSGPEGLELYVKKMEEVNLSQEQMSFMMESMASDTTALLPLLINNAEGMHLWADAGERAGVIINDKTREAAKALKVEMKLLDMQMEGAKNQVMQALLPAMVDITSAFLTSEGGTISLTGATDTLATSLKFLSKTGLGVASVFDIVGTILGGSVAAMVSADVRAEDVIQDLEKKIAGYGDKFDRIDGGGGISDEKKKRLIEIEQERAKLAASNTKNYQAQTQGMKDFADKQDEASKKADKHAKAQKNVNKSLEEQARLREALIYEFTNTEEQMKLDYERKISDINKAGFTSDHQSEFLTVAKNRYEAESDLYLSKLAFESAEYKLTEDEKLNFQHQIYLKELKTRRDLSDSDRQAFFKHAQSRHQNEIAWLRLEQAERLNNAQEAFQTEMQKMNSKYEFERAKILQNKSLSGDDQNALVGASIRTQDLENDDRRSQAWGDFQNAAGIDTSAEDAQSSRDEAFRQALEWQLITQEEYQQRMLQSEAQFNVAKTQLGLEVTGNTISSWTEMLGNMLGEQSIAYKSMLVADKAVAVGRALLNVPEAYSEAFNAVVGTPFVGPYIAPVIGGLAAAAQVGQVTLTKGVDIGGIFHGGMEYVPEETSYYLDKGERVLSKRQNTDLTDYMQREKSNSSGMDLTVNVTTLPGMSADVNMKDGQLNIQMIRKEIDEYLPGQLSRASSPVSQAFSTYYSVPRVR